MCRVWRIALGLAGGIGLVLGLGRMPNVRAQETSTRLVVRPAIATTEEAPVQWTAAGRRGRGRWRDPAERARSQIEAHTSAGGTIVSAYEEPVAGSASQGTAASRSVQASVELGPGEQLVAGGQRTVASSPRVAQRAIGTHIELAPGEQLVAGGQRTSRSATRSALESSPRTARRTIGTHIELAPGEQIVTEGQPTPALAEPMEPFAEEIEPGVVEGFGPGAPGTVIGGPDCGCEDGAVCGHDGGLCGDECGPCGSGHPGCHGFGIFCQPYGSLGRLCICIPLGLFENLGVLAGAHGFKGPVDFASNGNFGIHEGFEWGLPLCREWGIGAQVGLMATQSNFEGEDVRRPGADRDQLFVTAGLFRRAVCGLQGGLVVDILEESYYFNGDLAQIRGEAGWVGPAHNELGFWFAANVNEEFFDGPDVTITSNDLFALYFRHHFQDGAEGRGWVGLTNHSDFIVGGDWVMPLSNRWQITGNVSLLVPDEGSGQDGEIEETWNIGLNLVWFPFRPKCSQPDPCWGLVSPFRPLVPLADNGYFMEEVQAQ